MWPASVVYLAISAILLLIAALATVWSPARHTTIGWLGLFFFVLALLVQAAHPFGWA